jgi:ATP-dependent DNA helicase RecG
VVKRARIEAPLPRLIEQTFASISPHIRERQQLVDLFFEERFEYPTFAWQEAIINAVAHRDYALEGTPIEIWIFDDRLEVSSPGELVEPVTLEHLVRRERIHASRNPRIVRVLTDWGYMRELGEGVPRMFEVMEREGLKPPEFQMEAGTIFTVILRNTPVYSPETLRWLEQFESVNLAPHQKRLLAYAHAHGDRFTNRTYQKLVGVDLYTASKDIKDLIRKGIVQIARKGGRVYEILPPSEASTRPIPNELQKCLAQLSKEGYLTNSMVQQILMVNRIKATRLLNEWTALGFLEKRGERRWTRYYSPPKSL